MAHEAPSFQLTVVTVCRNDLPALRATMASVLGQKMKGSLSIEHLVVDGASTDGTPAWLAEQQAAGNIEAYISEPDSGIYDAMNKGIRLARGHVLAFLNAGDTYRADTNLAPCVLPIVNGECSAACASARVCGAETEQVFSPRYGVCLLAEPCCHQAYFAAAAAYRELGGYDSSYYRCAADTDFLFREYAAHGCPLIVNAVIADFQTGGFSTDCHDDFRNEYLELLWRNWEHIKQRSAQDAMFRDIVPATLCDHCFQLLGWQQRHGKDIPRELDNLAAMCLDARSLTRSRAARAALKYLGATCLPRLARREKLPVWTRKTILLCQIACAPAKGNPYLEHMPFPLITPLGVVMETWERHRAARRNA